MRIRRVALECQPAQLLGMQHLCLFLRQTWDHLFQLCFQTTEMASCEDFIWYVCVVKVCIKVIVVDRCWYYTFLIENQFGKQHKRPWRDTLSTKTIGSCLSIAPTNILRQKRWISSHLLWKTLQCLRHCQSKGRIIGIGWEGPHPSSIASYNWGPSALPTHRNKGILKVLHCKGTTLHALLLLGHQQFKILISFNEEAHSFLGMKHTGETHHWRGHSFLFDRSLAVLLLRHWKDLKPCLLKSWKQLCILQMIQPYCHHLPPKTGPIIRVPSQLRKEPLHRSARWRSFAQSATLCLDPNIQPLGQRKLACAEVATDSVGSMKHQSTYNLRVLKASLRLAFP